LIRTYIFLIKNVKTHPAGKQRAYEGGIAMLGDLIDELIEAKGKEEREKVLAKLEKVGMDRFTAAVVAKEVMKGNRKGGAR
jgi:hypothetical protein